jgi:hypothetical protein
MFRRKLNQFNDIFHKVGSGSGSRAAHVRRSDRDPVQHGLDSPTLVPRESCALEAMKRCDVELNTLPLNFCCQC